MNAMPRPVYNYIFQKSSWQQIIVIGLTLSLLPLTPIPLELQRRILDDAVAKGDVDLLMKLAGLYLLAMFVAAGFKFAMRAQRELIRHTFVSIRKPCVTSARIAKRKLASSPSRSAAITLR